MGETIEAGRAAAHYNQDNAPFLEERRRYLRYFEECGASPVSLRIKHRELIWIAMRIGRGASSEGVDIEALRRISIEKRRTSRACDAAQRVVGTGRSWLRFLGWWHEPSSRFKYRSQLDDYVRWMRDERGFTPSTIGQWTGTIEKFLRWCDQTNRQFGELRAEDLDAYFISQPMGRWSRVSVANVVSALRAFLRYAGERGMCAARLAGAICSPRLYRQESLPYAPDWLDVQRMLNSVETDKPQDIRDRAVLLLLAVYGMRSGEVSNLCLDQIDWAGRNLWLFRLKRRQPQVYPLVSSVAEALARYIDTVRRPSACPEVFLCMQAPYRPLKAGSIYDVANRRFVALGIETAHRGGHALRHACATRLLAEGLTMKEIGDHLGHSSVASTSIYAKVNLAALREVGVFDLGEL